MADRDRRRLPGLRDRVPAPLLAGVAAAAALTAGCSGGDHLFDGTPEEWFRGQAACLDEQGWSARLGEDGRSLHVDEVGPEEREDFKQALRRCRQQLGTLPQPDG